MLGKKKCVRLFPECNFTFTFFLFFCFLEIDADNYEVFTVSNGHVGGFIAIFQTAVVTGKNVPGEKRWSCSDFREVGHGGDVHFMQTIW